MNHVVAAREHLESVQEGAYAASIEAVLAGGGILHAEPRCFLLARWVEDEPGVLHVVYANAAMSVLKRVVAATGCKVVEWRRDFTGREHYGERRRPLADFFRHEKNEL